MQVASVTTLVHLLGRRLLDRTRPLVVALDGRSGAGKSTLAAVLAAELDVTVVDGDAFFAGGVHLRDDSPEARAHACVDWRRQREVLSEPRAGRSTSFHAFDWTAFDGSLEVALTTCTPSPLVVLEGVYSARPELADLLDLRVLVEVADPVRLDRLQAREGGIGPWESQWHEAEAWYFAHRAPPSRFDLVIPAGPSAD